MRKDPRSFLRRARLRATSFALLLTLAGFTAIAHPAPARADGTIQPLDPIPMPDANVSPPTPPAGDVQYHNGSVIHLATVYLIFWGPNWSSDSRQGQLVTMFQNLNRNAWLDTTLQYYDQNSTIFNTTHLYGGSWSDTSTPPASITKSVNTSEVDKALNAGAFPINADGIYMVFTQNGSTLPGSYCGWHTWHAHGNTWIADSEVVYPYTTTSGNLTYYHCTVLNRSSDWVHDGLTWTAGHELAEAATDPFPYSTTNAAGQTTYYGGWWVGGNTPPGFGEVADKCDSTSDVGNVSIGGLNYRMQELYSNDGSTCTYARAANFSYSTVGVTGPSDANMAALHPYPVKLSLKNTGNVAWAINSLVRSTVTLSAPSGTTADYYQPDWGPYNTRVELTKNTSLAPALNANLVAPGETGEFDFTLKPDAHWGANGCSGCSFAFSPLVELDTAMSGGALSMNANVGSFHAAYAAENYPSIMVGGLTYAVWIEYTNTGTAPWYFVGQTLLATGNPNGHQSVYCDTSTWFNCARPTGIFSNVTNASNRTTINPGETGLFKFNMAPQNQTVPIQGSECWDPVEELVAWFNVTRCWSFTVVAH